MPHLSSYSKIYALGHRALASLFDGEAIVEEKVDGSQISFGVIDGELCIRSKGADINVDAPDNMFARGVEVIKGIAPTLIPGWVYRGEYLQKPKHNTLVYDRIPRNHIVIFDIDQGQQDYMQPGEKADECERIGLECVPRLKTCSGPMSQEKFQALLENVSFLGGQKVEGVVIKNYGQFDADKKVLMAKYVSEAFKEVHRGDWKERNPGPTDMLDILGNQLRTPARWSKAIQHLREFGKITDSPRDIGPLIKEIAEDVREECEDEIKDALFKWAWPKIQRHVTAGFPQWYKDQLAAQQFDGVTEVAVGEE